MIKKALSIFLALALLLGTIPAPVFADGETGSGAFSLAGVTVSGTAFDERAVGVIAAGAVYGPDEEELSIFYMDEDAHTYIHRISLWSTDQIDPSLLGVSGAAAAAGNFTVTEACVSTLHQTIYYLYRAPVQITENGGEVSILCNGTVIGVFDLAVGEYENPYFGEAVIVSRNEDGSLTMEFSGCTMPDAPVIAVGELEYDSDDTETVNPLWEGTAPAARNDLGVYTVTLAPLSSEAAEVPWQTVSIDGAVARYFGGSHVQIAEMIAINASGSDDPIQITVPPTISGPGNVTAPTAAISIVPGDYPEMQYQLDGGSWTAWAPTGNLTVTLTEGDYGLHTVRFQFRTADGTLLEREENFTYTNGVQASAPERVFLKDNNPEGRKTLTAGAAGFLLTDGAEYVPAAVFEAAEDEAAALEALVYTGSDTADLGTLATDPEMSVFDMVRVSGTNVYEAADPFTAVSGGYRIGVRVKQGTYDAQAGAVTEITADALRAPAIYNAHKPSFSRRTYDTVSGGYLVYRDSTISASFSGTVGASYIGSLVLSWTDASGASHTTETDLDYTASFVGWYTGEAAIPEEAAALGTLSYRIRLADDPSVHNDYEFDLSNHILKSVVTFRGIPANYEGARLFIGTDNGFGGMTALRQVVLGTDGIVKYEDFDPGTYLYEIRGESGVITSGTFAVAAASSADVTVTDAPVADLAFTFDGAAGLSSYAYFRYRIYYGPGAGDYLSGTLSRSGETALLRHVPVYMGDGTTPVRVEVCLESGSYEELAGPDVDRYGILTHTMTAGENTASASVRPFTEKTLSGRITTPLGKPQRNEPVYVLMKAEQGWPIEGAADSARPVHQLYRYAYTDDDGNYSVSGIWADKDVTVTVDATGGRWYGAPAYQYVEFSSPAAETVRDIRLEYSDYGSITVDVKLLRTGETEETEGDCGLLQAPEIFDANGYSLNWHGGENGVYYLNDVRVRPGDTVTIQFGSGKNGTLAESGLGLFAYEGASTDLGPVIEQTVTLDASGSASARFLLKEFGTISASPAPNTALTTEELLAIEDPEARADALAAATRYEGYLYVYRGETLVAKETGFGELKTPGLPDGQYTVVMFYLDTRDENYPVFLSCTRDPDLILDKSSSPRGQSLVRSVAVHSCEETAITETPPAPADVAFLGGLTFGVKTELLPDFPGWVQVKINLIKRSENVRIQKILVNNKPAAVASSLDTAYVDGEKMDVDYTSFGYRYVRSNDTRYVEKQDGNEYVMFFTHSGDETDDSGKPIARADIRVEYDFFREWAYDPGYWWSGEMSHYAAGENESVDELSITVPLDPFDIDVPPSATFDPIYADRSDFGVITTYVYGNPGDTIAVYDNDRKVSERVLDNPRETVRFRVSNPESYGVHRIRACRIHSDGTTDCSETKPVVLINRAHTVYTNELTWVHRNDTRLEQWHFRELEDMSNVTFRYYPAKPSIITFRLNNVKENDLDNVRFVAVYHGAETSIRTTLIGSGVDPATGRSYCEYMVDPDVDGLIGDGWEWVSGSPVWKQGVWIYPVAIRVRTEMGRYADGENPLGRKYQLVRLGYFDDFYVDYELVTRTDEGASSDAVSAASMESYAKATGTEIPDLNDLVTANVFSEELRDAAQESMPAVLRDGYADGSTVTTSSGTDTTFSYSIENGTSGICNATDMSDTAVYGSSSVAEQMAAEIAGEPTTAWTDPDDPTRTGTKTVCWAKYETAQGTVYIRQIFYDYSEYDANGELVPGGRYDVDVEQEVFAPQSVVRAVTNGTTVEGARAALSGTGTVKPALRAAGAGRIRIAPAPLRADSATDEAMSRISMVGNIHGAADIYQDYKIAGLSGEAADKARFMSEKFNRGMAVVGAACTMYDIAKGVQGKNPEALFQALDALDMSDGKSREARQQLMNEIVSYEELRSRKYMTDSLVNGGTTIAGVSDPIPPAKIGLLIGGLTYNEIGGHTQDYLDLEFDSIMRSILLEYQRQEQRNVEKRIELEKELYKKYEKIADVLNWKDGYWDPEEQKTLTRKQRIIREVERELNNRFNKEPFPRFNIRDKFPTINLLVDPSGYVYEAIPEERVGGITATIYEKTSATSYTQWVDTNSVVADRQANPQTTAAPDAENPDAGGRYGWMTPYGTFKVAFTDPAGDYKDAETNDMTVPPEHTAVNIGLLSTAAPEVDQITVEDDGSVTVVFSKFMQMESLVPASPAETAKIVGNTDRYDSYASVATFYDPDGNPIPGTVSFPDSDDTVAEGTTAPVRFGNSRVRNTYYRSGTYQKDEIGSDWFAKVLIFTPDDPASFDPEHTNIRVSKNALSYAGVGMAEDYTKNVAQAERETAPKIYTVTLDANGGSGVPASLTTGSDGTLSVLPEPSRTDYTFDGWFTSAGGGTPITASTVFTAHTTVFAHWTYAPSSVTPYVPPEEDGVTDVPALEPAEIPFTDVPEDSYYYDAVAWAVENGITEGMTEDTFGPELGCLRADIVTFLWRVAGSPEPNDLSSASVFRDVPAGSYFEKAVAWAVENGITEGTSPETFDPYAVCKRSEAVTFLWRYEGLLRSSAVNPFADVANAAFYHDAVLWAFENGITEGTSPETFSPEVDCTRGQTVTFLYRAFH